MVNNKEIDVPIDGICIDSKCSGNPVFKEIDEAMDFLYSLEYLNIKIKK